MSPVLKASQEKRAKLQSKLDALLAAPTAEARSLTDAEADKFEGLASDIKKLDAQIQTLEAAEKRAEKAADAAAKAAPAVVKSESMTYDKHGRNSYFRDLATLAVASARLGGTEDSPADALERMQRHNAEVDAEARTDKQVAAALRELRRTPAGMEARTNPNTTAGTGGEFVPPLWLVSQYVPFMRAGRVFANRVRNMPLPPGQDVINIPVISGGSLTAIQTANAAAVTSQDVTTSSISAPVRTIAGQEDISLQLLEQSPIAMDGVLFDDLSRDYDKQLDTQIISGSGTSGQHKGVLSVTGATSNTDPRKTNQISSTVTALVDATAGNSSQYKNIINAVNQIETLRFDNPTAIWVHPRRANGWGAAPSASDGRPLFLAAKYGQFNAVGSNEPNPLFQGVAGELYGLPVVKDANMLTTANGFSAGALQTGGNQDVVVVLKEDDVYLWEGTMRMRALPEILSGTLQIRFQVYAYSAFTAERLPAGISVIAGTGYIAPGF